MNVNHDHKTTKNLMVLFSTFFALVDLFAMCLPRKRECSASV